MPSIADLIYACPECSPLQEMRLVALDPDREIDPAKTTAFRLECPRCGQWWFKEREDQPWVKGYGRVNVEKREAKYHAK